MEFALSACRHGSHLNNRNKHSETLFLSLAMSNISCLYSRLHQTENISRFRRVLPFYAEHHNYAECGSFPCHFHKTRISFVDKTVKKDLHLY